MTERSAWGIVRSGTAYPRIFIFRSIPLQKEIAAVILYIVIISDYKKQFIIIFKKIEEYCISASKVNRKREMYEEKGG
jgi:dimeric dUTPase (all-alpha-NTP-PPase superfamily)